MKERKNGIFFLQKKLIFYGQRAVTAAWATRCPWSISFIKTLNSHNNDFPKENVTIKQGENPFDMKEGNPALSNRNS